METVLSGLLERMDDEDLAEVCDTLVWKVEDNGTELMEVCRSWLRGDDPARVQAALAINNGFLFPTREEMRAAFAGLAGRFPRFRPRTEEILRSWDARFAPKAVRDVVEGVRPLAQTAEVYGVTEDLLRRWVDEAR